MNGSVKLLERESALSRLGHVVDEALHGRGGAVLIEGEAGIGKTSVLNHSRAIATEAGARVLHATGDEVEARVPLALARALLARAASGLPAEGPGRMGRLALEGRWGDPSGPGSRADEVIHALWWLVVELADELPLAVFLDDAHWADHVSLELLRMAARRASELPLAVVVAARPAEPGQPHSALAAERAFTLIELAPLSAAATARMVAEVLGQDGSPEAVGQVRAVTAGNPLYLSELLNEARHRGADPSSDKFAQGLVPIRLVALISARLERLPPAAAKLARAIALLGTDASPRRARSLANLSALEAAAAEQALRAERVLDRDRCGFTHPLVGAVIREGVNMLDAAALHERAAMLLADDGVENERVAEHLTYAIPRGDATVVERLRRAGESARRVGAPEAAARLLERAANEPPSPEQADHVDFELGRALLASDPHAGEQGLSRLLRRTPDLALRGNVAKILARSRALSGNRNDAIATLNEAISSIGNDRRELRLELLAELACIEGSGMGGRRQAMKLVEAEIADSAGQNDGEKLLGAVWQMLNGAKQPSAEAAAREARELLRERLHLAHAEGFAIGSVSFWATATLINADRLDDAEQAMSDLRSDAEEMGLPHMAGAAVWQQCQITYQRGDLAQCEIEARIAIDTAGNFARRLVTPWLVMTLSEQDRLDEAEGLLATAGLLGQIPTSIMLVAAQSARGRLRLAQSDSAQAIEDLTAALERSEAWAQRRLEPPWRPFLAEALFLAGRTDEASAEADSYTSRAHEWGTRRALGHAARMRSITAPRANAIKLLEEARDHFTDSHARLELARCTVELGTHLRASGERRAARSVLRDAHDVAHACGATTLRDRARAQLLLAGGRPRPPTGTGANALTTAERRVAALAASGLTNPQIARTLYLSPKTIEMHLRSSYRKLDLPGRDHLAAALDTDHPQEPDTVN